MSFFVKALAILLTCNLGWWVWAHVQSKNLKWPWRWRIFVGSFVALHMGLLAWVVAARLRPGVVPEIPLVLRSSTYIWHLVMAPGALMIAVVFMAGSGAVAVWGWARRRRNNALDVVHGSVEATEQDGATVGVSRRRVLAAAIAAPPALTGLAVVKSLYDLNKVRIREIEVPVAGLPRSLEGMTIAHVTDTHVGRYSTGPVLRTISDAVNALRCDFIAFTGDLVDSSHADIPEALEMIRRFDAPTYLCEGNHDLFEGREEFDRLVRAGGANLLTNQDAVISIRGTPVQILGIRWGSVVPGMSGRDANAVENTRAVAALRRPGAFPFLLAHHPHAFDTAAGLDLPLTLAGHTHGGQLMLSEGVGAGPVMFRYWSGRYAQRMASGGVAQCIVSNGAGNWFPLRLNAPAEIIRVTLRRA